MNALDATLGDDDAWTCEHADGPPRRLRLADTADEFPGGTTAHRRILHCPDCGALWRVWPEDRVARPYVDWSPEDAGLPCRRASALDIDRVVEAVRARIPEIVVTQFRYVYPADDDGIWYFGVPGIGEDVHVESSTGSCPFILETEQWRSHDARTAATAEETADMVVAYLGSLRRAPR